MLLYTLHVYYRYLVHVVTCTIYIWFECSTVLAQCTAHFNERWYIFDRFMYVHGGPSFPLSTRTLYPLSSKYVNLNISLCAPLLLKCPPGSKRFPQPLTLYMGALCGLFAMGALRSLPWVLKCPPGVSAPNNGSSIGLCFLLVIGLYFFAGLVRYPTMAVPIRPPGVCGLLGGGLTGTSLTCGIFRVW